MKIPLAAVGLTLAVVAVAVVSAITVTVVGIWVVVDSPKGVDVVLAVATSVTAAAISCIQPTPHHASPPVLPWPITWLVASYARLIRLITA